MDRQYIFIIALVLAGAFFFGSFSSTDSTDVTGAAILIQKPIISYYDWTNTNLKIARCGNAACSSGNVITTVGSPLNDGQSSSIKIGRDGLPIISYYELVQFDLKVAHCGNLDCTSGNVITVVDPIGRVGYHSSLVIGRDGLPIISYYDYGNGDLKVAHCGNLDCTSGNVITVVDNGGLVNSSGVTYDVGEGSSIQIGRDGLPIISYSDKDNHNLKVAHCGNLDCTSGNVITVVDNKRPVETSVVIGKDGFPIISYMDVDFTTPTSRSLIVAHCGNLDCTSGNVITVVDTGEVGYYNSIEIGRDGFPIISYYDGTNANLKIAHCGNLDCTAGNTVTTVDSIGSVGAYNSITINGGLATIAYYDSTNANLKVLRCGNLDCTSGNVITVVDSIGYVGAFGTSITPYQ